LTTPSTARRAVSILDVARRAGVSASTVSRSLRGADNVSDDTRHRVLQAAQGLAYVPSPAASRLVTGRTRTIGAAARAGAREAARPTKREAQ
jgi:DNA-binding LacI/PurR family transcriptional regulator